MAPDRPRHTFISYSRINKEFALKLAQELKAAGFPIWLDQLDIHTGKRWDDEIEKALSECGIFMVILTPASIASDNAKDEIGYAIDHGKRILPVLLEDCEIPLRLRRFQYVDFTKMNYTEGARNAKELLTRLIEEESAPTVSKITAAKERPTQPAKVRSARSTSGHRKAASTQTASEALQTSPKQSSRTPVAIFAGIAAIAIFILIGAAGFLGGMFPFQQQQPTSRPTQGIRVTNTVTPTVVAHTSTPVPQGFYTEEFDSSLDAWTSFITGGQENEFVWNAVDGKLIVQVSPQQNQEPPWAYLIIDSFKYIDVQVEVVTTNLGVSGNGVSLVCRYSDSGWYEFWISNDGTYRIYAFGPGGTILESGYELEKAGSSLIRTGQATNVYTATCQGNELSLEINGTHEITTPMKYGFPAGSIGIGFSAPKYLPVEVEFESLKISEP